MKNDVTQKVPNHYPASPLTVSLPCGILCTVKILPTGKPLMKNRWLFCLKGAFRGILKRKEYNIDDRGEANYISTVVYILVVVVVLAVIMDVLAVLMTKQKMDAAADQITRQIQLAGKVDEDTESLIDFLTTDLGKADNLTYHVDTSYITKEGCSTAIQLGTPFYLTISADLELGGFWQLTGLPIRLTSSAAGVSERYWK